MTTQIDPDWAWSPYEPTPDQPWDVRRAAHLMRRAGFAASQQELQSVVVAGPIAAVDTLVTAEQPPEYVRQMKSLSDSALATGNPRQLSAWWAYRMLGTPAPLLEKLTLFWHGHFATSAEKVADADLMFRQNRLLRTHALGDFAELVLEISRDPAMLIYLDSATNRKAHPNENYAREIMELFCLGEGNYSERDIRELARCFTGWEVKRKKFRFNRYQYDSGPKTILGQSGKFRGEDGVRIVVAQDAAPEFIAMKLVKFLVMDEPQASAALLQPLAQQLRASEMQIAPVVKRILTSQLFYSKHSVGRKLRSPVELAVGFLRALKGSTNSFELADALDRLGQGLFYPPSVKGWDGGRTWINSSTLLGRSNLIRQLLDDNKTRFGKQTLPDYLGSIDADDVDGLFQWAEDTLFAVPVSAAAKDRIRKLAAGEPKEKRLHQALHALCTLPEFQLC